MSNDLPTTYLVRHSETAWSISGQHTGLTDIPLTSQGERDAIQLGPRLRELTVASIYSSPLQRALRTCELAGMGQSVQVEPDLVEWNYGEYEGLRSTEIRTRAPQWDIYHDGCPGGETPQQVSTRAGRVINHLRTREGNNLLFSHGHFIRVLAARWLGLELPAICPYLLLGTASLCALGYDRQISRPVIQLWNST